MPDEPLCDPHLREAMETCRPGHDDLAEPEMAALARQLAESPELAEVHERLQRLDAALADAFRDVPVPDGLEARILARLKANSVAPRSAGSESTPAEAVSPEIEIHRPLVVGRRRWLVLAGGLTAVAAMVLLMLFGMFNHHGELTKAELLDATIEYHSNAPVGEVHILGQGAAPRYHLSPTLRSMVSGRVAEIRWRELTDFLNRNAVAFDLIGPEGKVGTVYVTSCSVEGLPAEVSPHPMHSTGQTAVSAWQEGDLVYVLVVDGGNQAYERLFAGSFGPLA